MSLVPPALTSAGAAALRPTSTAVLVLGLTWALASCSGGSQTAAPASDTVTRGTVSTGVSASGALAAKTSEQLGFAVGGKLTSVNVKVGQKVEAGDVLATIDSRAAEATLKQAEASVDAQSAVLAGSSDSPAVQNAAASLARARHVVLENEQQGAASTRADSKAVSSAKKQKKTDEDAKDDADDAVDDANDACDDAQKLASKAAQAAQEALSDPTSTSANALATIAASAESGASTACGAVGSAEAGVTAAKQRVAADEAAITAAEQRKRVDDAALDVAEANANAGVATAQGAYDSAVAARPHTLDQQQALVDAAQAQVDAAQKTVNDTTLKAPEAGTISAVNGSKGEYLSASTGTSALAPGSSAAIPGASGAGAASAAGGAASPTRPGGTQFIVLSGLDQLQVVLPFEESDAAQIKKGQKVDVQLDAIPDLVAKGTVDSVAPSATPISGVVSYYATVSLDSRDPRERDGQTANATVLTNERDDVLTVPNSAVRQQGGASTVVVYDPNGTQRTVSFEAGVVGSDRTEVVSGLNEGDRVVVPSHP